MRTILSILLLTLLLAHAHHGHGLDSPGATSMPSSRPVVVAYPDSGINPYHQDFLEPTWVDHPSTYIPGYPGDAEPLYLTLDAPTYEAALEADAEVWANAEPKTLYYVPGTRIIGMQYQHQWNYQFLDDDGHGTAVASAGSGKWNGVAPNTAIVAIGNTEKYPFVAENDWIDVTSDSHGCIVSMFGGARVDHRVPIIGHVDIDQGSVGKASQQVTREGRLYVNGAGNGLYGYNGWCDHMPPWSVVVGQARITTSSTGDVWRPITNDSPFELMAISDTPVATHDSINQTRITQGTSIASPKIAGFAARLIEIGRDVLGHEGGVTDGRLAVLGPGGHVPPSGPLADGDLTDDEVLRILHLAARTQINQSYVPNDAVREENDYLFNGYGLIDEDAYTRAEAALLGEIELAPKPYHDVWHHTIEGTAWEFWHPIVCLGEHDPTLWAECKNTVGGHYDPGAAPPPTPSDLDP